MIRNVFPNDLEEINEVGGRGYEKRYWEDWSPFTSKCVRYPQGTFVYILDNKLVGYIITIPYIFGEKFPIDGLYEPIENPTCYYIHDLCVDTEYRYKGIGKALVEEVLKIKMNPKTLVSVQDSEKFWEKFGFKKEYVFNYCDLPAKYMVKRG